MGVKEKFGCPGLQSHFSHYGGHAPPPNNQKMRLQTLNTQTFFWSPIGQNFPKLFCLQNFPKKFGLGAFLVPEGWWGEKVNEKCPASVAYSRIARSDKKDNDQPKKNKKNKKTPKPKFLGKFCRQKSLGKFWQLGDKKKFGCSGFAVSFFSLWGGHDSLTVMLPVMPPSCHMQNQFGMISCQWLTF